MKVDAMMTESLAEKYKNPRGKKNDIYMTTRSYQSQTFWSSLIAPAILFHPEFQVFSVLTIVN